MDQSARESVERGLAQAAAGEFSTNPPDIDKDLDDIVTADLPKPSPATEVQGEVEEGK